MEGGSQAMAVTMVVAVDGGGAASRVFQSGITDIYVDSCRF